MPAVGGAGSHTSGCGRSRVDRLIHIGFTGPIAGGGACATTSPASASAFTSGREICSAGKALPVLTDRVERHHLIGFARGVAASDFDLEGLGLAEIAAVLVSRKVRPASVRERLQIVYERVLRVRRIRL